MSFFMLIAVVNAAVAVAIALELLLGQSVDIAHELVLLLIGCCCCYWCQSGWTILHNVVWLLMCARQMLLCVCDAGWLVGWNTR